MLFVYKSSASRVAASQLYIYIYIFQQPQQTEQSKSGKCRKENGSERWNLTHIFVSNIWHKQTTAEAEKLADKLRQIYTFARAVLEVNVVLAKVALESAPF